MAGMQLENGNSLVFLSRAGYILEEFFFANFSSLRGENSRKVNYQFCTQKSGGTFQVFNIEIRERLQADHWSSNCRGYLHIIMSKSLEVLMVIVFSPPQVSIDTFITSVVQIFREIELMYL